MFNPFHYAWWHISFVVIKIKRRLFKAWPDTGEYAALLNDKKVAATFIEDCTDCGGDVMRKASSKSVRVLDDLRKNGAHLEHLSCEIDPLENVDEIPKDSVESGNAKIDEIGTRSRHLYRGESLDYDSEIKGR